MVGKIFVFLVGRLILGLVSFGVDRFGVGPYQVAQVRGVEECGVQLKGKNTRISRMNMGVGCFKKIII